MLDAHQLNVFLVSAETLNFTAAGRRLNMSQPSVSQHIHALEDHFGAKLFAREGRHLRLTDAGLELLPLAREMVSLSVEIDEHMTALEGQIVGHLRVGCATTAGKYVLPFLLSDFMQRHPHVRATCAVSSRQEAVDRLCAGEVHLAMANSAEFANKQIEYRKLFVDPILLVVPADHPWAERGTITPCELREADFVLRESSAGMVDVVQEAFMQVGVNLSDLNVRLKLGHPEAIALAVQEGLGVGFVSTFVARRVVADRVKTVRIEGVDIKQEIYLGYAQNRPKSVAQEAFWRFATDPHNPILKRLTDSIQSDSNQPDWANPSLAGMDY